jgi:hypothetical protein
MAEKIKNAIGNKYRVRLPDTQKGLTEDLQYAIKPKPVAQENGVDIWEIDGNFTEAVADQIVADINAGGID